MARHFTPFAMASDIAGRVAGLAVSSLSPTGWTMTVIKDDAPGLSRAQNRLLRRIYNGRTIPIVADGRPFLTYKDAGRYLRSLAPHDRDRAYAEMKEQAKSPRRSVDLTT